MRRASVKVWAVGIVASIAMASGEEVAAGAGKVAHGKGGAVDDASVTFSPASLAKLKSDDLAEVREGLDDARLAGPKAVSAIRPIVEWLRIGLPYPLAEAAIDTLADVDPREVQAIVPYTQHRELKVRRAAVRALGKAIGPQATVAITTLRSALGDPDSAVRAAAALGLGSLHAKVAVSDLLAALDRRVYEAASSIGQVCEPADCEALVARLGKVPFDVETTGLDQMLSRPASEVSDDAKIAVIHKVRDVGTRDVNHFLKEVAGRWPKNGSVKVRRELDAAIMATLSSPGGGS